MRTTNTLSIMCAILVGLTSTMASAAFAATQSSTTNNLKPANKKALFQKEKSVKKSLDYIHRTGLGYCSVWMRGHLAAFFCREIEPKQSGFLVPVLIAGSCSV